MGFGQNVLSSCCMSGYGSRGSGVGGGHPEPRTPNPRGGVGAAGWRGGGAALVPST